MKKLLVALLALAIVGGAFAQTFSLGASGTVTLFDNTSSATFARDGSGYDLLTFKGADKDGKWGYSVTLDNFDSTAPFSAFRDWTAWYMTPVAKVLVGNNRNADFRATLPGGWYAAFGATDRFFGGAKYSVIAESNTLGALTLGLGLAIPEAGVLTATTLQQANIGVKYVVDKTLTAKALARLDLVNSSNVVNLAVDYVGVENLDVVALAKITAASATSESVAIGAYYTMDKLTPGFEFSLSNGTTLAWDASANVGYAVTDAISAYARGVYRSDATYNFDVNGTYDFGNGLTAGADLGYGTALTYDVKLGYAVSF